ncbi:hypothetical protein llap_20589 [Limosa lapponica baueri]|uniref:Uncharacterized protein n=1 Tax=Limosa lapponica baueri TaxID=1758121 RepID=A0A2I0T5N3_LIMLA|nr:hypothetical protein llap_20589 [Limosa lapponica baueri]
MSKDTIPNVPDLSACLNKLLDLSERRAEDGSPKERAAAVGLGDGEVTTDDVPDSSDFLSQPPDFSQDVAEGGSPTEHVVVAGLRDSKDNVLMSLISPTVSPASSMSSMTSRSMWQTVTAPRTKRYSRC